jgi:hypothetical protein
MHIVQVVLQLMVPGACMSPSSIRSGYVSVVFCSDDGDTATITIPPGHTLSGLCGRSGDSLDNLGLIIGPHLPPCLVNLADVAHPDFLARCPVDFQQQAAALTAALQGMPTDVVAGLVGWLFTVTFHGQP